jgi:hypothetical protein
MLTVLLLAYLAAPPLLDYYAKRVAYYSSAAGEIHQKHFAFTESLKALDFGKTQVCPPTPSPFPVTMAQRTIPTHEISLDDGLKLISDLRFIEGSVELKVAAPPENLALRNRLLSLFQFPQSLVPPSNIPGPVNWDRPNPPDLGFMKFDGGAARGGMRHAGRTNRFNGFQIVDDDEDSGLLAQQRGREWTEELREWEQLHQRDVDAPPPSPPAAQPTPIADYPNGEIIVHGKNLQLAQEVAERVREMGLNVKTGSKISPEYATHPNFIYIEMGRGYLWSQ